MTQSELNQLVAHQTGEEESTIQARGFMLHEDMSYEEREPLVIDWDIGDATTITSFTPY